MELVSTHLNQRPQGSCDGYLWEERAAGRRGKIPEDRLCLPDPWLTAGLALTLRIISAHHDPELHFFAGHNPT